MPEHPKLGTRKPPPRGLPPGLTLALAQLEAHGEPVEVTPRKVRGRLVEPALFEASTGDLEATGPTIADALVALGVAVSGSKADGVKKDDACPSAGGGGEGTMRNRAIVRPCDNAGCLLDRTKQLTWSVEVDGRDVADFDTRAQARDEARQINAALAVGEWLRDSGYSGQGGPVEIVEVPMRGGRVPI